MRRRIKKAMDASRAFREAEKTSIRSREARGARGGFSRGAVRRVRRRTRNLCVLETRETRETRAVQKLYVHGHNTYRYSRRTPLVARSLRAETRTRRDVRVSRHHNTNFRIASATPSRSFVAAVTWSAARFVASHALASATPTPAARSIPASFSPSPTATTRSGANGADPRLVRRRFLFGVENVVRNRAGVVGRLLNETRVRFRARGEAAPRTRSSCRAPPGEPRARRHGLRDAPRAAEKLLPPRTPRPDRRRPAPRGNLETPLVSRRSAEVSEVSSPRRTTRRAPRCREQLLDVVPGHASARGSARRARGQRVRLAPTVWYRRKRGGRRVETEHLAGVEREGVLNNLSGIETLAVTRRRERARPAPAGTRRASPRRWPPARRGRRFERRRAAGHALPVATRSTPLAAAARGASAARRVTRPSPFRSVPSGSRPGRPRGRRAPGRRRRRRGNGRRFIRVCVCVCVCFAFRRRNVRGATRRRRRRRARPPRRRR